MRLRPRCRPDPSDLSEVRAAFSRRDVLRYGVLGTLAVGTLSACGRAALSEDSTVAVGPPKKGGALRVGVISGGQTETLDPWRAFSTGDTARVINLYDPLFEFDDELVAHPALAESAEPNADNTAWVIRLREGVTFHDGSPLTADDLIYNAQQWTDPSALFHQQVGYQIDPKQLTRLDDRTVRLGLTSPNARLDQALTNFWGLIKSRNEQAGGPPIGTGPFRYSGFRPGTWSEFVSFENHWRPDPVLLDRLVIDSSFTDENARTSALNSGQIDVLPALSFDLARTLTDGRTRLLRAQSGQFQNFYMRVDAAPFDDVRVRQALRLLVDRQALVDVVYAGYGLVSNDVPGRYTRFYDEQLTRSRDVDQAKFLLRQAGQEGLAVTLQTSNYVEGLVRAATLFKQQAAEAGVTVNLEQVEPSSYFDPNTNYGKMNFAQTYYYPVPSLDFAWTSSFASAGPSNETHWYASPSFGRTQSLLALAKATNDASTLQGIWAELQKQQFDEGGYINWGTADYVDAVGSHVQGLTPSKYLNASGFNFRKAWLS